MRVCKHAESEKRAEGSAENRQSDQEAEEGASHTPKNVDCAESLLTGSLEKRRSKKANDHQEADSETAAHNTAGQQPLGAPKTPKRFRGQLPDQPTQQRRSKK